MRVTNMLTAYAHPSCKAIFYRSESAVRDARTWLEELGVEELGDAYLSKIQVLYPTQESCPSDLMEAKWKTSEPSTVVFCGRDYESKNGRMALKIFSRLSREFAADRFVYIGEVSPGELRRHLESPSLVEHHQSLAHERTLSVLSAAHILFHPSEFEGLGTVFVEAAASGMAVITATGGPMRHVEELFGTGGAMLVDRDKIARSEEASVFEAHLRHLLNNRSAAKRMAYHNFRLATVGKLSPERNRRILLKVCERAHESPTGTPLTLEQIPYRGGAVLRFNSPRLVREETRYRQEAHVRGVRFLL
jgi:glycosyltransferase involved in cell wall biosynthesis